MADNGRGDNAGRAPAVASAVRSKIRGSFSVRLFAIGSYQAMRSRAGAFVVYAATVADIENVDGGNPPDCRLDQAREDCQVVAAVGAALIALAAWVTWRFPIGPGVVVPVKSEINQVKFRRLPFLRSLHSKP